MFSRALRFALFFMALSTTALYAQSYFLIGGGLNFASFRFDLPSGATEPDNGSRTGLSGLIGFQSYSGDHSASVVSLGYEQRGGVFTGTDFSGAEVESTVKFDYMHLGFAYKLLSAHDATAVYFAPNADLALLINSEAETDGKSEDIKEVNGFDMDLGGSIGVQVPVGRNAMFFEAGYVMGLFNTETGSAADQVSVKNNCIKLRVGFLANM